MFTYSDRCSDNKLPVLGAQAVNSLDGQVVDDYTLTKPSGWRPNQAAQLATIALFHSNYTPTWLELSGINGPAEDLVLRPAEALLFSDPELLHSLRNATLVKVAHPLQIIQRDPSCYAGCCL